MKYEIENCVSLDFETYSDVDLRSAGLDNYVNGEHFRVLLASVKFYHPTGINTEIDLDFVEDPKHALAVLQSVIEGKFIVAHNAQFEQFVLRALGIDLPASRFIDTAVLARAAGYGGSLEASAAQLLGEDKVEVGAELIKVFCIPSAEQIEDGELWFDESLPDRKTAEWITFKYYCRIDARLSWRIAEELLPQFYIQEEIARSHLTMQMNDIGWYVDLDLVHKMDELYHLNTDAIRRQFAVRNDAHDLNLSSLPQLVAWCKERGVTAKSFDEKSVASMLKRIDRRLGSTAMPESKYQQLHQVKDLLETKQQLGGSSLKKLDVILKTTSSDGRLRNQYMHVGAGATFRTTGRGVQMQNLKRLHGDGDDVREILLDVAHWDNEQLATNMRQVFSASHPQGQLIVGDFSSVESRGLAWQADEQWKLHAYSNGQDLYKVQAASMFQVPVDQVTKDQRQIGKVGELACGYGAGPDAVRAFADKMGVELSEVESAKLVKDWRTANPRIVGYWQRLDDAMHQAIENGGVTRVTLPQGVVMFQAVPAPESLREQVNDPALQSLRIKMFHTNSGSFTRWIHGVYKHGRNIQYWKPSERKTGDLWTDRFTDPKTKQQRKYSVYGGKLAGLLTQSLCREVFFESLANLQPVVDKIDNLQVVGQFHDEIVLEWKPGMYSLDMALALLEDRMTSTTLVNFPLGAEIKHAHRYIK
jgi:DNA polymerase bacteriophage-type